ncbi:MAG TPA: UDP-glucose/GDP-mannose dehydrogenase family protein [Verrucomicrobiae bacterium]|nr:UDP-glucose/GDP-mannose dehydrogenase family protein [Verrucomicrobiae bacterium]
MQISIFGMGYVGAVCAATMAESGHTVTGIDVSPIKVDLINRGKTPIVEPGLEPLLRRQVAAGRVKATSDVTGSVASADVLMICVGTPSMRNGGLDLRYVEEVSRQIGEALKHSSKRHTIVVRSTVLPGTTRNVVVPILEAASGKKAGTDFGVCMNPEFLRESTAIKDYYDPPMTVIGEWDAQSGDVLAQLYSGLAAPLTRAPLETAEMVKYACNSWHATKITFANEIGTMAKAHSVDGRDVMQIVCLDRKLNLSSYYMKPGFAFGGSCLPKDLRAMLHGASQKDVELPMLRSIMQSNKAQVDKAVEIVASLGKRKIGMLGLSFKADTDDLRESPLVDLAEALIGKGYELSIFDRNVDYARVHGANREYINSRIPHVSSLLKSNLDDVVSCSDVMVIGNKDRQFEQVLNNLPQDKIAVDLVGFMQSTSNGVAQGIGW